MQDFKTGPKPNLIATKELGQSSKVTDLGIHPSGKTGDKGWTSLPLNTGKIEPHGIKKAPSPSNSKVQDFMKPNSSMVDGHPFSAGK